MSSSVIPGFPHDNSAIFDLSRLIFSREEIEIDHIVSAGLSGPLRVSLVESLVWGSKSSDSEIKSFMSVIFGRVEDIAGYLQGLILEDSSVLERFLSTGILEKLAVGELSAPRLSQVSSMSSRQVIVCTISGVLHNNCQVIKRAPATWRSVTQAITSGEDRADIINLYLDELGVDSRSRLLLLLYVWSQGDSAIVSAAQSLSGTDDYDIAEAALSIDGISDYPAYELIGISECLSIPHSSPEEKVSILLNFLARTFELAAERVESDPPSVPLIVSLNLKSSEFRGLLSERRWNLDPNYCDIVLGENRMRVLGSATESSFDVKIRPGYFSVKVAKVTDRYAEITLIRTVASQADDSTFALWKVETLVGSDGRSSIKEQKEDGFIFQLLKISNHDEQVIINPGSDDIKLTISWTRPIGFIDKTITAPPMLPTEIHLPPVIPSLDPLMRTIPLVPQPRLVLVIRSPDSAEVSLRSDLVTIMDMHSSYRDLHREILSNDTIIASDEVVRSDPFIPGMIVGADKMIHLIDSAQLSSISESLIEQGFARIFSG